MNKLSKKSKLSEVNEPEKATENWPRVLDERWITNSRLFYIQEQKLRFSNGGELTAERINPGVHSAVLVAPLLDQNTLLLIREYGAGIGSYYLSFPKGAVAEGETLAEAANRELMEEAGYAARQLNLLRELAVLPAYMGQSLHIFLASDLYEKRLPGDEPEPPQVVPWPINELDALLASEEFCESSSTAAALLLARTIAQQ